MKSMQLSPSPNSTQDHAANDSASGSHSHKPLKRAPLRGRKTDPGVAGKANQDSYALFSTGPKRDSSWEADPEHSLYVVAVADGVTGQAAGANASEVAVHTLQQVMSQRAHKLPPPQCLREAFEAANAKIVQAAREDSKLRGMSTTLVAAVVDGWRLYLGHVGDSRAYLIRGKAIHRLTLDHTWVQEALDAERLTDAEARTHTNRHNLLRYLGNPRGLDVDQTIIAPGTDTGPRRRFEMNLALQPNDVILLCSDGVTDKLKQPEILAIVRRHRQQPRAAARALVNLALERREEDNITAVLLSLPDRRWPLGLLGVGATVMLLAALATFALWPRAPWQLALGDPIAAAPIERGDVESQPSVGDASGRGGAVAAEDEPDEESEGGIINAVGPMNVISQVTALLSTDSSTDPSTEDEPEPPVAAAPPSDAPLARPTSTRVATRVPSAPTPTEVPPTPTPVAAQADATATATEPFAARPAAATTATASAGETVRPERSTAGNVIEAEALGEPTADQPNGGPADAADAADNVQDWLVRLRNPLEANISGQHIFLWEPNFTLPETYLYELIFWRVGDSPLDRGFSPVGAGREASVVVELTESARSLTELQPGRDYFWGVLLVDAEDTQHRIKLLSEPQPFRLSTSDRNQDERGRAEPEPEEPSGEDGQPEDEQPRDDQPEEEEPR